MAAGLPVVAYSVGGNSELLGDQRGVLIPAGNEINFADVVQNLLSDFAFRQKLGRNARQFRAQSFGKISIAVEKRLPRRGTLPPKGQRLAQ